MCLVIWKAPTIPIILQIQLFDFLIIFNLIFEFSYYFIKEIFLKEFFNRTKQGDNKITKLLSIKRSIYFLHLLGLDTNGHGHKPNSKKYLENIKIVDKGIERIVKLFENYFNDRRFFI